MNWQAFQFQSSCTRKDENELANLQVTTIHTVPVEVVVYWFLFNLGRKRHANGQISRTGAKVISLKTERENQHFSDERGLGVEQRSARLQEMAKTQQNSVNPLTQESAGNFNH